MAKAFLLAVLLISGFGLGAVAQVQPIPMPTPPSATPPPAPVVQDPSQLTDVFKSIAGTWDVGFTSYGNDIFVTLAIFDLSLFGWRLWRVYGGNIQIAMMEVTNKVLVVAMFTMLLFNGSSWMSYIVSSFVTMGKSVSGVSGLGPSIMLAQGFKIFGPLLWAATRSGVFLDIPTAIALLLGGAAIAVAFLVITIQFVVTEINMFLVMGCAHLFLAFGGSKWTTNYVERFFAFAFATGIKLMVLYLLAGAAWPITESWVKEAGAYGVFSPSSVQGTWLIACGAVLYAVIVWSSSSLVSSMLGGHPTLTQMDVISFMGPAISAGLSAAMIATGFMAAPMAAAGAAGAAAAGAGTAAASAGGGASAAAAATTAGTAPQMAAGGGGLGAAGKAVGQLAQVGARAIQSAPSAGQHHPPSTFGGFGNSHN